MGAKKGSVPWNKGRKFDFKERPSAKGRKAWNKGMKFDYKERPNAIGRNTWNKGKKVLSIRDENHHNWKGENVKKEAKHRWVYVRKGKPTNCEDCGVSADDKQLDWSNVDHRYRRVLDDYVARCRSCHRKYDIKYNGYENGKRHRKSAA